METLRKDAPRALSTLVLGFSQDPIMRWLFPEPDVFLTCFRDLLQYFGGGAFEAGGAFHTQCFSGAALWLPPGVFPDEDKLVGLFEERLEEQVRDDIFTLFEQMDASHPTRPVWHLAFIATDPRCRGRGLGAKVLRPVLERCDSENVFAYLESTNAANLGFYRRHGFRETGRIQAGESPPIFPMIREPG